MPIRAHEDTAASGDPEAASCCCGQGTSAKLVWTLSAASIVSLAGLGLAETFSFVADVKAVPVSPAALVVRTCTLGFLAAALAAECGVPLPAWWLSGALRAWLPRGLLYLFFGALVAVRHPDTGNDATGGGGGGLPPPQQLLLDVLAWTLMGLGVVCCVGSLCQPADDMWRHRGGSYTAL